MEGVTNYIKEIGAPWVIEIIAEKFDYQAIELLSSNAFVYGGAVRDALAGLPILGDLDIVVCSIESSTLSKRFRNSVKWTQVTNRTEGVAKKPRNRFKKSFFDGQRYQTVNPDSIVDLCSTPEIARGRDSEAVPEQPLNPEGDQNCEPDSQIEPICDIGLSNSTAATVSIYDDVILHDDNRDGREHPQPVSASFTEEVGEVLETRRQESGGSSDDDLYETPPQSEPAPVECTGPSLGEALCEGVNPECVEAAAVESEGSGWVEAVSPRYGGVVESMGHANFRSTGLPHATPSGSSLKEAHASNPYHESPLLLSKIHTFVDINGTQIQIVTAKEIAKPRPGRRYAEAAQAIHMVRNVDLICCGVIMNDKGEVFEVIEGAYEDCKNKILHFNSDISTAVSFERVKKRINSLEERGWTSKVDLAEVEEFAKKLEKQEAKDDEAHREKKSRDTKRRAGKVWQGAADDRALLKKLGDGDVCQGKESRNTKWRPGKIWEGDNNAHLKKLEDGSIEITVADNSAYTLNSAISSIRHLLPNSYEIEACKSRRGTVRYKVRERECPEGM